MAEEAAPLDPIAPLQDDDENKELLELSESVTLESMVPEPAEGDDRVHEELDSSIALLSPPSGPELLASSPHATRLMHAKKANTTKIFGS